MVINLCNFMQANKLIAGFRKGPPNNLELMEAMLHGISSYPLKKQTEIIIACLALHNFIRDSQLFDLDFY